MRKEDDIRKYFCELLGSIILFACLVWGFVASLTSILVIHDYGKFKISLVIPKRECYMFSDNA